MDQLRDSLSEPVATTTAQVQDAVSTVTEKVTEAAEQMDEQTEAQGVRVEVVEETDVEA